MRKIVGLAAVLVLVSALSACGTKNNNASDNNDSKNTASADNSATKDNTAATNDAATPEKVTKVIVGTGNQFPKVAFLDESGKLTGFDVELVREIDKKLPEYEFDLQVLDFQNILLSLETKKIDMAAHEFEKNPEREAKYLFNKEPYAHWKNKIIVSKDNNDPIQSLDDLKGKKFFTTATSAEATILENYNKDHDNALKIVYSGGGTNDIAQQITSGRVDATIGADFILPILDPQGKLKTVGKELSESDILFVFRKNDPDQQKLADAVDKAIVELRADGTLANLSKQWLGFDATESEK